MMSLWYPSTGRSKHGFILRELISGNRGRLSSSETTRVWKKWNKTLICHDWWGWYCWEYHVRLYAAEVASMRPKVVKSRIWLHQSSSYALTREKRGACVTDAIVNHDLLVIGLSGWWAALCASLKALFICSPCSLNTKLHHRHARGER